MIARLAITAIGVALLAGGAAADTVSDGVRNSIARLNYAGHGTRYHCTATVVAPNAVMTTKSCIASIDPTSIHLVSGFDRGNWTEHRRVTRAIFDSADHDVVLLCTDATFEDAGAFTDLPDAGGDDTPDSLLVAGYWAPRHQTLNVRSCGISERRAPDGSMMLDCGVPAGGGGAPAFTETDGTVRLHGIAIAGPADTTRIARWRGDAPEQACTFP